MTLVLPALLCGCNSPGERAELEYHRLEASGAADADKCRAAAQVARVWLGERNSARYREWKSTSDLICARTGRKALMPEAAPAAE